jgi:hypothetical protein
MALRPVLVILLLTALALAGCASHDPPAAAPAPAASQAAKVPVAPETVTAKRMAVATPVHLAGQTRAGGCAYVMGVGSCQYQMGHDDFAPLDAKGQPLSFQGTVTWAAAAPTSAELMVYILVARDNGYWWDSSMPTASGPSPLSFDLDLGKVDGGIAIYVGDIQGAGAVVGYVNLQTPQDFVLDGTYTSVVLSA